MKTDTLLLCLSNNPELLEIRTRVLATRYRVVPLMSLDAMKALPKDSAFDVLVLCHTLNEGECQAAVSLARDPWPAIKIIILTTGHVYCSDQQPDGIVDSLAGGTALLHAIDIATSAYPPRE